MTQISIDTLRQAVLTTLVQRAPKVPWPNRLDEVYVLAASRSWCYAWIPLTFHNYRPYDREWFEDRINAEDDCEFGVGGQASEPIEKVKAQPDQHLEDDRVEM